MTFKILKHFNHVKSQSTVKIRNAFNSAHFVTSQVQMRTYNISMKTKIEK